MEPLPPDTLQISNRPVLNAEIDSFFFSHGGNKKNYIQTKIQLKIINISEKADGP